jgi:CRISPR-associated protein Cas1
MNQTIYIFSDGELKKRGNTLCFITKENKKFIPIENIREIFVLGEVTLNKRLFEFLTEKKIIIHFFNYYGYYIGSYYPREHLNSGYMILKQAEHYLNPQKRILLAKKFVIGATENMKKVLSYYDNRGKPVNDIIEKIAKLSQSIDICESVDELMAI